MGLLDETLSRITEPDREIAAEVEKRWNELYFGMMNPGGLKNIVIRYARAVGERIPEYPKKAMIIAAGDHGVSAHDVSAYPKSTTAEMVKNYLISKGAAANAMAAYAGADLSVIDVGVAADLSDVPGLIQRKIREGTDDITEGPAMTREEAVRSIECGIEIAEEKIEQGYKVILPGDMGISNTTSSAAVIAALNGWNASEVTGRGSNISDERYGRKVELVQQALDVNRPDKRDALDVLSKVGGFEIGCMAGMILGAASRRGLVILDGFNAAAAMMIAHHLTEYADNSVLASHVSREKGHEKALDALKLDAPFHMNMAFGEAAGAALMAKTLDFALHMYRECATKEELGVGTND